MTSESELRAKFNEAGQNHVFTFWNELNLEEKNELLEQLSEFEPSNTNEIYKTAMGYTESGNVVEPLPKGSVATSDNPQYNDWNEHGLKLISQNKVAVVLLAGGQGTRLGSSDPKGCYDIGLPSKKSLFLLQAERLSKLQNIAAAKYPGTKPVIPWYIMTSKPTRLATESFILKEATFGGLVKNQIFFFDQGVLPAFNKDGKIILEAKNKVSMAPDGNGGLYMAMANKGVLSDMKKRGVEHIHAYCVDNSLAKVGDPAFIGYCAASKAPVGAKVVRKNQPDEPVGVVCLKNKKFSVVEYSEISKELSEQKESDGKLTFFAGNIANHYYSLQFLEHAKENDSIMPFHIAHKKIKCVDIKTHELIKPTEPNGVKMERFIFDVFPLADKLAVFEVPRQDEFSPLKNAPKTGVDCPETCKRDLMRLHVKYLRQAGAIIAAPSATALNTEWDSFFANIENAVEISPLVSYNGEDLEAYKGREVKLPFNV